MASFISNKSFFGFFNRIRYFRQYRVFTNKNIELAKRESKRAHKSFPSLSLSLSDVDQNSSEVTRTEQYKDQYDSEINETCCPLQEGKGSSHIVCHHYQFYATVFLTRGTTQRPVFSCDLSISDLFLYQTDSGSTV